MTTRDCIVLRTSDGVFWDGKRWTNEYPEAQLYTESEARKVAQSFSINADYASVARNYGTASWPGLKR